MWKLVHMEDGGGAKHREREEGFERKNKEHAVGAALI